MKQPPEPLAKDEMLSLLNVCGKSPSGIRDQALLVTLWRGMLRIGEALALRPSDYDPAQGTLRVRHGKGDKYRVVALDPQAQSAVDLWVAKRRELGLNGHQRLFCTLKGKPVDSSQIRHMLKRRAKKAGLVKRVHAHGLRHTGASELVDEGADLLTIQTVLGHSSPVVTQIYLHRLNPKKALDVMRARSW